MTDPAMTLQGDIVERLRAPAPTKVVGVTPISGIREVDWDWAKIDAQRQEAAAEIEALRAALKPFAVAVYNDNGDMTVSAGAAKYDDYVRAYFAYRCAVTNQGEKP